MFLVGALTGMLLFIVILASVYLGYVLGRKKKPSVLEVDEELKREAKERQKAFSSMMDYDVNKALQRKRV